MAHIGYLEYIRGISRHKLDTKQLIGQNDLG